MKSDFDYTYEYQSIHDELKKGHVLRVDHWTGEARNLNIALWDRDLLLRTTADEVSSLIADLSDLAVAVYVADHLSERRKKRTTRLLINLPIRSVELRERSTFKQELRDLLYWFTEDLWSFQFSTYRTNGRQSELHKRLISDYPKSSRRVALWSGGLDALAGLYLQLVQEPETDYTLVSTGSSLMMGGKQKKVFQQMNEIFPGRLKLIQLPIRLGKKEVKTEQGNRTRGFVFLLLGALCALQEMQHTLYIHENGIGAINLPFRDCEVGLDHSRSVHPLTLARMGTFLEKLLGHPFSFENPFLGTTKAEMCQRLLREHPEIVFSTMSCDHWHREIPLQCGYCSSCLLRRQAIAVSGIEDTLSYRITAAKDRKRQKTDGVHLRAMLAQVDTLRDIRDTKEGDIWGALIAKYPVLDDIVRQDERAEKQQQVKNQLLHLYQTYVKEWDQVSPLIQEDMHL
ncbi:7-cyano-7-deazaguanine synthase [Tengunoibacter tsumagoiensis]|uniref:7-cyano-7-deazaguanine synthase n=1 Tax=Tengunoibacter tsumagoiensis TaxID=2014871 RepID=A0A402A7I3_9CHLR|nr:7-cyano-7-deazaguanine synthase [Tengunoibacter tsumagoiensis]GCE15114.1 hypothetical protein KTT_49730 [Tengunoibacter tsumagoiensis]